MTPALHARLPTLRPYAEKDWQRFLQLDLETVMGIVREARGQGLGRLLMQRAEAEARERGIEDIELSVAGNNRRARELYRDLGYETTRRTMRKRLRG